MKKGLTQMVFVLDMSGSMSPLTMETIGGYNAMIADQKKEEGDALVTTVLFDHRYNMIHDGVNIKEVKAIGRELGLPSELVDKVPTDGLCGKTDEDNLGFTYDMLDRYIRTGEIESEELKQKIDTMHKKNLFKLALMPSFEYTNPVEAVVLDDKQTGYDIVSEYIKKYWEHHCTENVIVSIEISRDGKNYERLNEVASPYDMYDVEYLNDWWEGEKYIRVTGIQGISDIKIKKL